MDDPVLLRIVFALAVVLAVVLAVAAAFEPGIGSVLDFASWAVAFAVGLLGADVYADHRGER